MHSNSPGILFLVLTLVGKNATPSMQRGESPAAPIIRDCAEGRDCSLTVHAIGHWVYLHAALAPEDLDRMIAREEADVTIQLRPSGTMQVLERIQRVRFEQRADDELQSGVRVKLEFRRGTEHVGDLYVAPSGEVFDGHGYYSTRDRNWLKGILNVSRLIYGP